MSVVLYYFAKDIVWAVDATERNDELPLNCTRTCVDLRRLNWFPWKMHNLPTICWTKKIGTLLQARLMRINRIDILAWFRKRWRQDSCIKGCAKLDMQFKNKKNICYCIKNPLLMGLRKLWIQKSMLYEIKYLYRKNSGKHTIL